MCHNFRDGELKKEAHSREMRAQQEREGSVGSEVKETANCCGGWGGD